jgi:hypothetical protein
MKSQRYAQSVCLATVNQTVRRPHEFIGVNIQFITWFQPWYMKMLFNAQSIMIY